MLSFFLIVVILLVLLALGVPVAFSLGATSLMLIWMYDLPMQVVGLTVFSALEGFVLLAVPLYILMSQILLSGKVGDNLFDVMNVWVRHFPGGLATATILACAFFAAITGSGAATAATIGMVAFPAMISRGYERSFTLGLLAAGGTLGILIPPSIPLILYGSIVEESIGKLFMAGVVPGVLMTLAFIAYAVVKSVRSGFKPLQKASWRERLHVTRQNAWSLLLPLIILAGIYTGVFTPTEAAAVGVFYSLVVTLFIYKTLTFRDIPLVCLKAVTTSCMICTIIVGATLFGKVMTMLMIPQLLTQMVVEHNLSMGWFLLCINLLMLGLGMILETVSIILLTIPLLLPIMAALHIDPIWYAIILTINMEMALITPPVGVNLYVINGLQADVKMEEIIRGVWPFILIMAGVLGLIMLFPELSTWLPSVMSVKQ
ncbi:TRAP transporter large permease [Desulfovibrio cuneatus]|uniref:TRAP transporter large permease n=1 Tax=Desulfovibrio cuneatus TaxID=159728 RepID=UPI000412C7EC|nr:TRAP transporter large permease [Desulfovibrio cuneatus]